MSNYVITEIDTCDGVVLEQIRSGIDSVGVVEVCFNPLEIVEIPGGVITIPAPKFTHVQAAATTTWVINHNLGFRPLVQAYTSGGLLIVGDIAQINLNQTTVSFTVSIAGYALLS